jgi:hypothetical protein
MRMHYKKSAKYRRFFRGGFPKPPQIGTEENELRALCSIFPSFVSVALKFCNSLAALSSKPFSVLHRSLFFHWSSSLFITVSLLHSPLFSLISFRRMHKPPPSTTTYSNRNRTQVMHYINCLFLICFESTYLGFWNHDLGIFFHIKCWLIMQLRV